MQKTAVFILLMAFIWACAQQEPEKEKEAPAQQFVEGERSELALAMRDMYEKMKLVSDSMKAGHEVHTAFLERFMAIHTAKATKPEMVSGTYQGMAELFMDNYERFEADTADQVEAFNAMIETCVACHQQQCPGPLKIITRLRVHQ